MMASGPTPRFFGPVPAALRLVRNIRHEKTAESCSGLRAASHAPVRSPATPPALASQESEERKKSSLSGKSNWTSRVKATRPYRLAHGIKRAVIQSYSPLHRVIRLEPEKQMSGRVLISYYIEPYLLDSANYASAGPRDIRWHASYWECTEMARSFLERGYAVDVIGWQNDRFVPRDTYEIFFDCRHNMQRLAPLLPPECLKIFHIDTAHILFHDAAESERLLAVQRRRGITLRHRRFEPSNFGIEHADCATLYGNRFTQDTSRTLENRCIGCHIRFRFFTPGLKPKTLRCAVGASCGWAVAAWCIRALT